MSRIKHDVGSTFGELTITQRLEVVNGSQYVLCDCTCGTTGQRVHLPNLVSGGTRWCSDRTMHPGHNWLGDGDLGYDGAHGRVKATKGSASLHRCVRCGEQAAQWAYSHADTDERRMTTGREARYSYSVNVDHYEARCRRCHARWDAAERRLTIGHEQGTTSLLHFAYWTARRYPQGTTGA